MAQSPADVVDSSRYIDWTHAGAGTIPTDRTQCGSTIAAYGSSGSPASPSTINTALTNCTAGHYVLLGAGDFYLSTGIIIPKSSVTLRGSGPDQTIIHIYGNAGCTRSASLVCIDGGDNMDGGYPSNRANWTAGFARGTTTITLGANTTGATRPSVGSLLFLDQAVDSTLFSGDTYPEIFSCVASGECAQSGNGVTSGHGTGTNAYEQFQIVRVTGVSGNDFTFTPGLYMPNWRLAKSPTAWWANNAPRTGVGIEDLKVVNHVTNVYGLKFDQNWGSWVKNVVMDGSVNSTMRMPVALYYSVNVTVRDSYIFNQVPTNASDNYAISCMVCGDMLYENNIIQSSWTPFEAQQGYGLVIAYNYVIHNVDNAGWIQPGINNHGGGANYWLAEGNDVFGLGFDNYFGGSNFITVFRNRLWGKASNATLQTVPGYNYAMYRFNNLIGNVLGDPSFHTNYEMNTSNYTTNTVCQHSIFALGLGGNCVHGEHTPGSSAYDDPHVVDTLMRWGNWDTVTNGTKWDRSEVPTGLTKYANAVPSSQTLPASFYLAAKPAWWGNQPWPAIGPDVTASGPEALANSGGHAYRIPARKCFEDVMQGMFGDNTARAFNANNCYASAGGAAPAGQGWTFSTAGSGLWR